MKTITISMDDHKLNLLENTAKKFGLSVNDLVEATFEDLISKPDDDFQNAMNFILKKNHDLYKKLS